MYPEADQTWKSPDPMQEIHIELYSVHDINDFYYMLCIYIGGVR
jgi:hypothetical protein